VIERKNGTKVTERRTERASEKQEVVKQQETKQVETTQQQESQFARKTTIETIETQGGGGRLGLNISLGSRIGLRPFEYDSTYIDVSYELMYQIAPRIGVEYDKFPDQLTKPSKVSVGLEIRL
jgi:hypothetical protein